MKLRGALDVDAFGLALREIVRRHEVLRTTFHSVDGQPVQRIAEAVTLNLEVEEITGSAAEREETVRALAREEAALPFDLSCGPLMRERLLRLADDDHALLITMHHIIADEWSIGVLVREFTTLYEAFLQGRPSPLPELTIQYADFANWQRQWVSGETLERQLEYWRVQLSGISAL